MGIDVNLDESYMIIASTDNSLSGTTVDIVIRMYIIPDESFEIFTTIRVHFTGVV